LFGLSLQFAFDEYTQVAAIPNHDEKV